MARSKIRELRRRVYLVLEQGSVGDPVSVAVDHALVVLILVNLVAVALESVRSLRVEYHPLFDAVEFISLVVFSVEYFLRIWAAAEHGPFQHLSATRARLKYILSPAGLIDLICRCCASCVSSRSRGIRRPCVRCSTCSTASAARCSAVW